MPIKSPEQQGAQMLARVRNQLIGRRTQLANSIRGYAAEFGFTAPKGLSRLQQLLIDVWADATVPELTKELVDALAAELARVDDQIDRCRLPLLPGPRFCSESAKFGPLHDGVRRDEVVQAHSTC